MKRQDILVFLKLLLWRKSRWTIAELAKSVGLSASETHAAIERGKKNGLFDPLTERPNKAAIEEFLLHGLKYVFPAEVGPRAKGIPTAHSASPLSAKIMSRPEDAYVWPSANGRVSGARIEPLYRSVPNAIQSDAELYEYLALIDALRVGRARERQLAAEELSRRLDAL